MRILQKKKSAAADKDSDKAIEADLLTLKKIQVQAEVVRDLLAWAQNHRANHRQCDTLFASPISAQVPEQD